MNPFHKSTENKIILSNCDPQFGGALLGAITTVGVIMVLVQGGLFYSAKESNRFILGEKNKVVAAQMAEAGVEDNIAEFGGRSIVVNNGMTDYVTFSNKQLGSGNYTTRITATGLGTDGDTVNLVSVGNAGGKTQSIQARLRLLYSIDSTSTPILKVTYDTTLTFNAKVVYDTTITKVTQDPNTMPDLDKTAAYAAFMGSGAKKANICHLPGGDASKANVIDVAKSSIDMHIDHHGDYISTDGTCDIYKAKDVKTITSRTKIDTLRTIVQHNTYDSAFVLDTLTRVQVLSWK